MITEIAPIIPTIEQRNILLAAADVLRDTLAFPETQKAAEQVHLMSLLPTWQNTQIRTIGDILRQHRKTLLHQANADFWVTQNVLPDGTIDTTYLDIASEIAQERSRQAQTLTAAMHTLGVLHQVLVAGGSVIEGGGG